MNLTHRPIHHPNVSTAHKSSSSSSAAIASTSSSATAASEVYNAAQGLLFAGFNQDASCFGVGTVAGFRIYNTDPLHERARREHVPFRSANPTFTSASSSESLKGRMDRGEDEVGGNDKSRPPRVPSLTRVSLSQDEEEWKRRRRRAGKGPAISKGQPEKEVSAKSSDYLRDIDNEVDDIRFPRRGSIGGEPYMDEDDDIPVRPQTAGSIQKEEPEPVPKSPSPSPPLIVEVEDDSDDYGFEMEADDDPTSPYAGLSSSPPGLGLRRPPVPLSPTSSGAEGDIAVPSLPPRPELDRPGGIAIVEMLYRSNYVALVGGGRNPKFPPNRVIIWDDLKGRVIMQLQFKSEVKAVKLRRDRIIIVFWNRVAVYTFSPRPRRLHTFETMRNDRGLVSLAPSPLSGVGGRPNTAVLAFLGRMVGQVQICELQLGPVADPTSSTSAASHFLPTSASKGSHFPAAAASQSSRASPLVIAPPSPLPNPPISIIAAHTSGLSCFTVSHSGHLIATASETGTLIRVFEARSGRLVNELRRGLDRAEIYCIAFNVEGTRLCVSSDKGTIHVFNVVGAQGSPTFVQGAAADQAVSASVVASQAAFPVGNVTLGGVVISGLGGNTIPSSPSSKAPPTISRPTIPATSPSLRSGSTAPSMSNTSKHPTHQPSTPKPYPSQPQPSTSLTSGLTNRLSTLSFFSPISKYFSSEWSFAQFSLPVEAKCICIFAASDRADDGPAAAARKAVESVKPKPAAAQSRALYFDPTTLTATSTRPSAPTWSPGPVTSSNAIICVCADGSFYKFCFETPQGSGSGGAARDAVLESFVRFYRGVGVGLDGAAEAEGGGVGGGDGGQGGLSAEGFVVSAAWGGGDQDDG
ncbi:WD repeat domain phosphoinositide-interacting protein 3 [Dinochytrium kinnereticum]|nr:WD repeat domain phosphoinositide-interacting protein 3 [Dinochytrium kinnereticum]